MFSRKKRSHIQIGLAFAIPILILMFIRTIMQVEQPPAPASVHAYSETSVIQTSEGVTLSTYLPLMAKCFIGLPHMPISTTTSFMGSIAITYPTECTVPQLAGEPIVVEGTYDSIDDGLDIWVLVHVHNNDRFYPQSDDACAGQVIAQNGDTWDVTAYLGALGDSAEWFDIVVVLADAGGTAAFQHKLQEGCSGSFTGMSRAEVEALPITEMDYVPIRTRDS